MHRLTIAILAVLALLALFAPVVVTARAPRAGGIEARIKRPGRDRGKPPRPGAPIPATDADADSASDTKPDNGWLKDIESANINPYGIHVGRMKFRSDIVKDDTVQPGYRSDIDLEHGRDVDEVSDYYIWREPDLPTLRRSITVQKPIVFIDDTEVASATVESWGIRSMRRLPSGPADVKDAKNNSDYLLFTLTTQCKSVGSTMLTITLRTFEMTIAQRSKDKIEFKVKRTCEKSNLDADTITPGALDADSQGPAVNPNASVSVNDATAESTAVPGFDVDFIGSRKALPVIRHGRPTQQFKPRAADTNIDNNESFLITDTVNRMDLSLHYTSDKQRIMSKPIIFIDDIAVLSISVHPNIDDSKGLLLTENSSHGVALSFSCLSEGVTSFTVMFTFVDDSVTQISFGAVKACKGAERVIGVSGSMIDVGVGSQCSEEVVDDGETMPAYQSVTKWTNKEWKQKAKPITASSQSMEFCVSTSKPDTEFVYERPQISAFSEDGSVIGKPVITGRIVEEKNPLTSNSPLQLEVQFRCVKSGLMGVTISIPFKSVGTIRWTFRKQCTADSVVGDVDSHSDHAEDNVVSMIGDGDQTQPIPGLNLGFSRSQHGQMFNGVVNNIYRLQNSTRDLAYCESKRQFLTFYLYQNPNVSKAVDVKYGAPELIATSDIGNPILSGSTKGGLVNATQHASFTVTFHCHTDGESMFTLRIPLLSINDGWKSVPPPRQAIVLQFVKACNSSERTPTVELGGVGIQGFRVGHSSSASDPDSYSIVSDGFPTVPYFGQKDLDDPDWNGIIVPETEMMTRLYFNYVGGDNIGHASLSFQPPRLVAHSSFFKPTLSGPATRGGKIKKNSSNPPYLDLTYNCKLAGLVTLNILVPMENGAITFTIPKQCSGETAAIGRAYRGLHVGLTPGGHEVVEDGLVQPSFFKKGKFQVMADEDVTVFYLHKEGGDLFQAIEPMSRAISPVAFPELEHDMYVSKGPNGPQARGASEALSGDEDSENNGDLLQDEIDDIYLDERIATLNVTYNCMSEGSTRVTVSMPLKIGYLDWTWTKHCPARSQFDHSGTFGVAGIVPGGNKPNTPIKGVAMDGGGVDDDGDSGNVTVSDYSTNDDDDDEPSEPIVASVLATPNHGAARVIPGGIADDSEENDDEDNETDFMRLARQQQERFNVFENDPLEEHDLPNDFNRKETINIATTKALAQSRQSDVVAKGKISPKYRPPKENQSGSSVLDSSQLALVGSQTDSVTFYVHTLVETQRLGVPFRYMPLAAREKNRAKMVSVEFSGPLVTKRSEVTLYNEDQPTPLTVAFQCQSGAGGIIPVIVVLPLVPDEAGSVQFYLEKSCPDTRHGSSSNSNGGIYGLIGLIAVCSIAAALYFRSSKDLDIAAILDRTRRSGNVNGAKERGAYEVIRQTDDGK